MKSPSPVRFSCRLPRHPRRPARTRSPVATFAAAVAALAIAAALGLGLAWAF